MALKKIILKNFRNYSYKEIYLSKKFVIVEGQNGAGKTNLLEAVSFFCDQKGMRKAKFEDLVNKRNAEEPLILFSEYLDGHRLAISAEKNKKEYKLDGKSLSKKNGFHKILKTLWISPQNDRLFQDSPEKRRNFFEDFITILFPEYELAQKEHKHLVGERAKILEESQNAQWLEIVEKKIITKAFDLLKIKERFLEIINKHLCKIKNFPQIKINISGDCFSSYANNSLSQTDYEERLFNNRARDAIVGGCAFGPHKDDFGAIFLAEQKPMSLSSTGQQCIGILSILLAVVHILFPIKNFILLIDEIITHLDYDNRVLLFNEIKEVFNETENWQVWITVTDKNTVSHILEQSDIVSLG